MLARCATAEGGRPSECDAPLQRRAKKLALLEVGGRRYESSHVYFCRELTRKGRERDPWRCQSAVTEADDSLHTIEAEHEVVKVNAPAALRVVGRDHLPAAGLIKIGVGPAFELHADGYVAARRADVSNDGSVSLPDLPRNRTLLLLALFRHDSTWVRKHVWVLAPE